MKTIKLDFINARSYIIGLRLNEKTRIWITKLRASNLRIPIETGRSIPEIRCIHLHYVRPVFVVSFLFGSTHTV